MKRATKLLLLAVGLAAAPLGAQTGAGLPIHFKEIASGPDTVYAALTGGVATVTVGSEDFSAGQGLGQFRIRIYFEPGTLDLVDARSSCPDSSAFPLTTKTIAANYIELAAGGCSNALLAGGAISVATVQVKLVSIVAGSTLYLSPEAVADRALVDRTLDGEGDFAEVCRALTVWGDVDDNVTVNSRDALIALTNAVGLPTTGFPVGQGDVDGDGRVSSLDALVMLSYAIGRPTGGMRVGLPIPKFCAPQATLPRTLYFATSGSGRATAGQDGLSIRVANDSAVTIPADSAADPFLGFKWRPRVSSADQSVLFVCFYNSPTFYSQICKRTTSGSAIPLTAVGFVDQSPDWSPAGDSIVFVRDGQIWRMGADGSGQAIIVSSPSFVTSVAWRPVASSRLIAYTTSGGDVRTRLIDDAATEIAVVAGAFGVRDNAGLVDWSPDVNADSLTFDMRIDGQRWAVLVAPHLASALLQKRVSSGNYPGAQEPRWTGEGILFAAIRGAVAQLHLRRTDGTVVRLSRGTKDLHFPGMTRQ